jgi:peptide/nickel transport system ATP-binding protein
VKETLMKQANPAPASATDLLLEVKDLKVEFPTREGVVRALRGVAFHIHKGETLGLVGESGCGKSVTSQAIMQIIPPPGRITDGNILWNPPDQGGASGSIDIARLKPEGREIRRIRGKDISMIFQEPMSSLSPVHTVGHQIMEAIRLHQGLSSGEAHRRAVDMLRLVGIPKPQDRVNSYSFELSGGMRQRAMIAIALSCHPGLLIADEPTTALDVTIQAQILDLIRRLQEEMHMAILLITHNLGVIAAVAQRIAVMYLGEIVEHSSKAEIFKNPLHPYTRGLINSVPKIGSTKGKKLWAIKGVVPSPYARVAGCAFHPRCPHFIPELCDRKTPPLIPISADHQVACFLYGGWNEA